MEKAKRSANTSNTTWRGFLRFLVSVTTLSLSAASEGGIEETSEKPNVILIMADDLGWGDVGYNGNPHVLTPELDRMAKEGIRMDRFYSGGAVCTPTRGSVMTGRNAYRYGTHWANEYPLPQEEITIAEALKSNGYATGLFGKWHLGTMTTTEKDGLYGGPDHPELYGPPWEHGFDTVFTADLSVPTYNPTVWLHDWFDPPEGGPIFIPDRPLAEGEGTLVWPKMPEWAAGFWSGPGQRVTEPLVGPTPRLIMERAVSFITEQVESERPFLATIWFYTPHSPIAAGDEYREKYPELSIQEQHWYGSLTAMDEQIGILRRELRRLNVDENTIILFCSDNGPSWVHEINSAGHFRGQKGDLYEGGIRVPGIVEWPAVFSSGKVVNVPMSTDDIYPTLLGIAGIEMENQPELDGIDVMPILTGEMKSRPKPLYFMSPLRTSKHDWIMGDNRQMAIMTDEHKLISTNSGNSYSLFDMIHDEEEKLDVSFTRPEQYEQLKARLEAWVDSVSD